MARPKITFEFGRAAVVEVRRMLADGLEPGADEFALAVRFVLQELVRIAPGNAVEVRVPPLGVVQCIEGPRHTRGTPPNVVEMDGMVLLKLATGELAWEAGVASGAVRASGIRADLSDLLPMNLTAE